MPSFFDQVIFDNPIRSYLWILGVTLFYWLLKHVISRWIGTLLFRLFPKVRSLAGKDEFLTLVLKPLQWFLLTVVVVLMLDRLNFPSQLNFSLYKISFHDLLDATARGLLLLFFIRLLRRCIDFVALILEVKARQTPDHSDDQLIVFFRDFFKVIVLLLGLLMAAKYVLRLDVSNLITGLSIVTAAIALATKESLENLIASFILFFDKPFTLGDVVKIEGVMGSVEKIGLRSTRIRTDQKTIVTVPNKKMVDSILDNLSQRSARKAEIRIELRLTNSADQLRLFIGKAHDRLLQYHELQDSKVFVQELGPKSIIVLAEFHTRIIDLSLFNELKQTVQLELLSLLHELNIELELSGAAS
jgi:MscS family membrane protein